jgi:hypothetical protein
MQDDFVTYLEQEPTIIHLLEHAHTKQEQQQLLGLLEKHIGFAQWRAHDFMRIAEKNSSHKIKTSIIEQLNIYNAMYHTCLQKRLCTPESQNELTVSVIENYGLPIPAPLTRTQSSPTISHKRPSVKKRIGRFLSDIFS